MRRILYAAMFVVGALALSAAVNAAAPQTDWLTYNNSYDSQRFSSLAQITPSNAADLKPACQITLGDAGLFQ